MVIKTEKLKTKKQFKEGTKDRIAIMFTFNLFISVKIVNGKVQFRERKL